MHMDAPVAALAGARRAMVAGGPLVAAVFVEPERVSWFTFPRRVLGKARSIPPIDVAAPGPFRYADLDRLRDDMREAGLRIDHVEDLVREAEAIREEGFFRLRAVTRIVVASATP